MKKVHFIAGLHRSGSTLLSVILSQNPRFKASMRSPIEDMIMRSVRCASGEFKSFLTHDVMVKQSRAIFETYYNDCEIAFDTNRAWVLRDSMLEALYPDHKMILCVRDVVDVLNSFEHVHKKNPFLITHMYPEEFGKNVFTRCEAMLSRGGLITEALQGMQQYLANPHNEPFILEYEKLVSNPEKTMKKIYQYIDEPYFEHDFNNVEEHFDEYDSDLNTRGLHTTRGKVEHLKEPMLLPQPIIDQVKDLEFWRK